MSPEVQVGGASSPHSGGVKPGVPQKCGSGSSAGHAPSKSIGRSLPSGVTRMLAGLQSRQTHPAACSPRKISESCAP